MVRIKPATIAMLVGATDGSIANLNLSEFFASHSCIGRVGHA